MVIRAVTPHIVHAHVECRNRGGGWWRYARPILTPDPLLVSILTGAQDDERDGTVLLAGVPADCSSDVRDDYTLSIAGEWTLSSDPRSLDRDEADEIVRSGLSGRWISREAVDRITDPAFAYATWLDRRELDRVLRMYERVAGDMSPATYCALLSMMAALERDYEVRLILWLERPVQAAVASPTTQRDAHVLR